MQERETFGKKIRALRVFHGWSQQELADKAGLKRSHISGIESDVISRHSVAAVFALSTALEVHPCDLFSANGFSISCDRIDRTLIEAVDPDIKLFLTTEWHTLTEAEKGILRHCIQVIKSAGMRISFLKPWFPRVSCRWFAFY